ncbi:MAG: molybdate ABC transporter substrate-binding protein [Actinobacteria bacterium]|nr:molybdate ABC transporter substrate-binding protein [Actinomycetota bacterium]
MTRYPRLVAGSGLVALLALAGCSGGSSTTSSSSSAGSSTSSSTSASTSQGGAQGELTVLAAASLRDVFVTIGKDFEAAHPGTKITFSFGPSSGLATQIVNGSPADVFASASAATMKTAADAGAVDASRLFARNSMTIVVPKDNPAKVDDLSDLADSTVKVAICAAEVPCGVAAHKVFDTAKLSVKPISEEADVSAVLTKVSLGEVDAGIVYVTDASSAKDKVQAVEIPAADNATTDYPIAVVKDSAHHDLAQQFTDFVLAPEAAKVLADAGFAGAGG